MTRFVLVFALSLAMTGPAMACGMALSKHVALSGAFDAIDAEPEVAAAAVERHNLLDDIDEVPFGSKPRLTRDEPEAQRVAGLVAEAPTLRPGPAVRPVRPVVTARPAALVEPEVATADSTTAQVRAFLRSVFAIEPAEASDTADTGDTGGR